MFMRCRSGWLVEFALPHSASTRTDELTPFSRKAQCGFLVPLGRCPATAKVERGNASHGSAKSRAWSRVSKRDSEGGDDGSAGGGLANGEM